MTEFFKFPGDWWININWYRLFSQHKLLWKEQQQPNWIAKSHDWSEKSLMKITTDALIAVRTDTLKTRFFPGASPPGPPLVRDVASRHGVRPITSLELSPNMINLLKFWNLGVRNFIFWALCQPLHEHLHMSMRMKHVLVRAVTLVEPTKFHKIETAVSSLLLRVRSLQKNWAHLRNEYFLVPSCLLE